MLASPGSDAGRHQDPGEQQAPPGSGEQRDPGGEQQRTGSPPDPGAGDVGQRAHGGTPQPAAGGYQCRHGYPVRQGTHDPQPGWAACLATIASSSAAS